MTDTGDYCVWSMIVKNETAKARFEILWHVKINVKHLATAEICSARTFHVTTAIVKVCDGPLRPPYTNMITQRQSLVDLVSDRKNPCHYTFCMWIICIFFAASWARCVCNFQNILKISTHEHAGYVREGTVTGWYKCVNICTVTYLVSGIRYVSWVTSVKSNTIVNSWLIVQNVYFSLINKKMHTTTSEYVNVTSVIIAYSQRKIM